jgi:hypothetical protein
MPFLQADRLGQIGSILVRPSSLSLGASLSLDLFAGKRASHGMQRTGSGSACLSIFGFLEGNEKKDPVTETRSRS